MPTEDEIRLVASGPGLGAQVAVLNSSGKPALVVTKHGAEKGTLWRDKNLDFRVDAEEKVEIPGRILGLRTDGRTMIFYGVAPSTIVKIYTLDEPVLWVGTAMSHPLCNDMFLSADFDTDSQDGFRGSYVCSGGQSRIVTPYGSQLTFESAVFNADHGAGWAAAYGSPELRAWVDLNRDLSVDGHEIAIVDSNPSGIRVRPLDVRASSYELQVAYATGGGARLRVLRRPAGQVAFLGEECAEASCVGDLECKASGADRAKRCVPTAR